MKEAFHKHTVHFIWFYVHGCIYTNFRVGKTILWFKKNQNSDCLWRMAVGTDGENTMKHHNMKIMGVHVLVYKVTFFGDGEAEI